MVKVEKTEYEGIPTNALVTVTTMKHNVEIQYMEKMNTKARIKKINSTTYMDLETGELKDFVLSENRSENLNSLRQTFKNLRYLVNNNFEGQPNELFVTLTYRGDLQTNDTEKIYVDFKKFAMRLRYKYKKISTIDYINVLEPHSSGNYHMHVLLRFNHLDKVYIPNAELAALWGNGFVTIQSLKDVDNIGAYISAYLADLEVPDDFKPKSDKTEVLQKEVDGQEKKFIKGGRLIFYPTGTNIFRKSGGIKYPIRQKMSYKIAKKKVGAVNSHFQKTIKISDEKTNYSNTISYEQYNLKRR